MEPDMHMLGMHSVEKPTKKRRRDNAEVAEDTFLPISNIARVTQFTSIARRWSEWTKVMKKALHSDTVLAKETIEAVQVMFVVGEATQHALEDNRQELSLQCP
eukprot:443552-Hanusia_phi.AAC.1